MKNRTEEVDLRMSSLERELLLEVLNNEMRSLRGQIYHAEYPAFRDALKYREELLQGLIAKVERSAQPA